MDYELVINAIADFFDGEYFQICPTVGREAVKGEAQHDCADFEHFDEVYVSQGGGGFTGDDFHGTAYFHIGNDRFAVADY